ncbi:MAG: type III-B CRISPR module-associated Cmr3 family protein, partial [Chloroflexota bacterium]
DFNAPDSDGYKLIPLTLPDKTENLSGYWLNEEAFSRYLNGETITTADCVPSEDLFDTENRFCVGIDENTNYRREGMLYNAAFVRPASGTGLLVDVTFDDKEHTIPDGIVPFGGEGKTAQINTIKNYEPQFTIKTDGVFKIVFTTPAYFTGGWQPTGGWKTLLPDVELLSVALPGSYAIGGWDTIQRYPRAIDRFVPAGSVFYFRGPADNLPDAITESSAVMADGATLAHIGSGCYAIGKV